MRSPSPGASRRYRVISSICLLVLLATLLSAAGQGAAEAARLRGRGDALPGPIMHAGAEPGLNVALERYDAAGLARALDDLQAARVRWLRQEFRWADLEPRPGQFDWGVSDRIVEATSARGFNLLAAVVTSPSWARDVITDTAPPRDPALFAPFARAFAQRYAGRVDYYQIWDEPNIALGWGNQEIIPEDYAALLQAGYTAMHAANPQAVVLTAGLAPTLETSRVNLSDVLFLRRLYEAGAAPYFDVVAAKPYGFDSGPDDRRVDLSVFNFSRAILLREEMEAHGDGGKALWASHLGWNALPAGWRGPASPWGQVDEQTQAAYTRAAVERARLEWPWAGVLFFVRYAQEQPGAALDPHAGFDMLDAAGNARPVYVALQQALDQAQYAWPGWHLAAPAPYVQFAGQWRFSELGADSGEPAGGQDSDRATLQFYGTELGLTVRRGDYRAHFYVSVDGQPANALPRDETGAYLILTSPDGSGRVDTLPVARDLPDGAHTAVLVAERGWGQWALQGFSVGRLPGRVPAGQLLAGTLALAALAIAAALYFGARADWPGAWQVVRERYLARSRTFHLLVTWSTALLFYGTTWLAWGESLPNLFRPALVRLGEGGQVALVAAAAALFYYSPWLSLSLLALLALAVLIYLRPDLGVALAVFFAPYYYLPKGLGDRAVEMTSIVIWLTAVAWALGALSGWRARYRTGTAAPPGFGWMALDSAVLFFLLVATLSLPFSAFLREALREYRTVLLEPVVLYALIRVQRLERGALWRLVDALVLSGVVVALIGLGQYALGVNLITAEGGIMRLRSVFGSPDNVGLYLGRIAALLAAVVLIARRVSGAERVRRAAYALAIVPVGLALLLSFSRGALLLGVPAGIAVVLLAWNRRRGLMVLAVLAMIATAGFALLNRDERMAQRLDLTGEAAMMRFNLWRSAAAMVSDHPLLGVGLDNFLYAYRGHYIQPAAWKEPDLSHPHNVVLDYATRLGLLGLAAGIAMQAFFWRSALRAWRRLRGDPLCAALLAGLMGAMADFLAHGLVDNSYFLIDLAVVFMVTLAVTADLDAGPTA